jgi:hypothetical protein
MTTVARKQSKPFTINTNEDYELGGLGSGRTGKMSIHLLKVASFDGTITVKARGTGSGAAYAAIPYTKKHLNGAVADDTKVSTGITDTSIIEVDCAGLDICLTCASRTVDSMSVTVNKCQGI